MRCSATGPGAPPPTCTSCWPEPAPPRPPSRDHNVPGPPGLTDDPGPRPRCKEGDTPPARICRIGEDADLRKILLVLAAVSIAAVATLPRAVLAPTAVRAFDPTLAPEIQLRLLDGLADFELRPSGEVNGSGKVTSYSPRGDDGCPVNRGSNVKVNQNCLNLSDTNLQGRAQAQNETSIAIDPMHTNHLVASFNDYR